VIDHINADFGDRVHAALTPATGSPQYLTLTSANGETFKLNDFDTALMTSLGLSPSQSVSSRSNPRQSATPFNQVVNHRTGDNVYDIDFFGVMDNLINTVEGGDVDGISDIMLSQLDNWLSTLLKCRATDGALVNRYTAAVDRMTSNNTNYTDLYTQTVGIDLADAFTDYEMAASIYQASLAAIARLIQPSLLDFLK
jgi:flagellar hook-associated protein 3 FlgL